MSKPIPSPAIDFLPTYVLPRADYITHVCILRSKCMGQGAATGDGDRACRDWLGGHTHACEIPHSQHFLQKLRGTWSAAPVIESDGLWVSSNSDTYQLCILKRAVIIVLPLSPAGFCSLIWKMVITELCIHIILSWTAAQKRSRGTWGICKCFQLLFCGWK